MIDETVQLSIVWAFAGVFCLIIVVTGLSRCPPTPETYSCRDACYAHGVAQVTLDACTCQGEKP